MSGRPQVGARAPLRAFRLHETPLEARRRATREHNRKLADSLQPERYGGTRLYGRPASVGERWAALDQAVEVARRSLFPSDRVYRVSQDAWDRMIARSEARGRGVW